MLAAAIVTGEWRETGRERFVRFSAAAHNN